MRIFFFTVPFLLLIAGCGYRFQEEKPSEGPVTISVPYIRGDIEGQLNTELVRVLSNDPHFEYRQNGGMVVLEVAVVNDGDERIGYRYDRNPSTGKRRQNIVGTENRRNLTVEVKLIDSYTEETIIGPVHVKARADYDYVDPNSVRDLTFTNSAGKTQTVINFSLGQLDSTEGAHDDAAVPIYRQLAQKIVDGIVSQGW
ncbi:MAG: hypothetical protein KF898_02520 [Parachlamydiales bacterium]|nr:hypothetical protein [Verrucomicrobiota bacterium]MBX3718506.1 hypothetical protein [Candidatus Acheromyda pituitae]